MVAQRDSKTMKADAFLAKHVWMLSGVPPQKRRAEASLGRRGFGVPVRVSHSNRWTTPRPAYWTWPCENCLLIDRALAVASESWYLFSNRTLCGTSSQSPTPPTTPGSAVNAPANYRIRVNPEYVHSAVPTPLLDRHLQPLPEPVA